MAIVHYLREYKSYDKSTKSDSTALNYAYTIWLLSGTMQWLDLSAIYNLIFTNLKEKLNEVHTNRG